MTRTLPLLAATVLALACAGDKPSPVRDGPPPDPALVTPNATTLAAASPDSFAVILTTSQGEVEIRVRRAWAPLGADRLHYLASRHFFDGARFFRVLPGFIAQFGLSGVPEVDAAFEELRFADDPVRTANRRGTVVFATAGPNSRTTQLFVNLADNAQLDGMGFAPFGEVVRGMDVMERLYAGYGEGAPDGRGPDQGMIMREGNRYLRSNFPQLDSIVLVALRP